MKRTGLFFLIIVSLVLSLCLSGCNEELKEEAAQVAESYNKLVDEYNANIKPYNATVDEIATANQTFNSAIDAAQASIDKGEEPFDETTETNLKDGIVAANDKVVAVPDKLIEKETVTVDEDWRKDELEEFISNTRAKSEELSVLKIPDAPDVPDYSEDIAALGALQLAYEDSSQGLKQITAPTDEFVMKRLQRVKTIRGMEPVTEDHDPNGKLNKQGGYIGCIYFSDSRVNKDDIYILDGDDSIVGIGCEGGGAVEVFSTVEDAEARDKYLAYAQSITSTDASHYVRGTCVIRTSEHLKGSEQKALTEEITQALIAVDR